LINCTAAGRFAGQSVVYLELLYYSSFGSIQTNSTRWPTLPSFTYPIAAEKVTVSYDANGIILAIEGSGFHWTDTITVSGSVSCKTRTPSTLLTFCTMSQFSPRSEPYFIFKTWPGGFENATVRIVGGQDATMSATFRGDLCPGSYAIINGTTQSNCTFTAMPLQPSNRIVQPPALEGHLAFSARYSNRTVMMVHGGWTASGINNAMFMLDTAYPSYIAWSTPVFEGGVPSGRVGHSIAFTLDNQTAIMYGGFDGTTLLADINVLVDAKWTQIQPECDGACPQARAWHSANLISDDPYCYNVAVASTTTSDEVTPTLDILATPMPSSSETVRVCKPASRMVIFGGNSTVGVTNDFFALRIVHFSPDVQNWSFRWMNISVNGTKPAARSMHGMSVDNDTIIM
jgi:hypothetical protein